VYDTCVVLEFRCIRLLLLQSLNYVLSGRSCNFVGGVVGVEVGVGLASFLLANEERANRPVVEC